MQLPGAEHAQIEPEKIRDYLLSPDHPVGRFKARFFASLGYDRSRWEALRDDLLAAARSQQAAAGQTSPFGRKFEVRATLGVPPARTAWVIAVWIVLEGDDIPRFVTAFPG